MAFTESVLRAVPRLRRYATAVTGSKQTGDIIVERVLVSLVHDIIHLSVGINTDLECFRRLDAELSESSGELLQVSGGHAVSLGGLDPVTRRAFLLTELELFTTADVAEIMGYDESTIESMIDSAIEGIHTQRPAHIIIADNDPLRAASMRKTVTALGHNCVGLALSVEDANGLAANYPEADLAIIAFEIDAAKLHSLVSLEALSRVFVAADPDGLRGLLGEGEAFIIPASPEPDQIKTAIGHALLSASLYLDGDQ